MKKFIALALAAALLTSCSTYRKALDEANKNEFLISPTVALVTSIVFEKSVSAEDKAAKAKIVSGLADKLSDVELVTKPTKDEFLQTVLGALPSDKAHWVTLATLLATQYDKATKNVLDSDVEQTVSVIHQIAFGLRSATAPYLD